MLSCTMCYHIISQVHEEKIDFFPLLHALALEKEEDETGKQLEELKAMVERVLQRFEEEVKKATISSEAPVPSITMGW